MKLIALKAFSWAHAGVRIEHFEKDQLIETDDKDLIKVATEEKWVKSASKSAKDPGLKDLEVKGEGKGEGEGGDGQALD